MPDGDDDLPTQQQLTTNGIVFGTLAYMAPETALGMSAVDARSDLYAAGVIFYELLAGKPLFAVSDPTDLFLHHRVVTPPRLRERAPEVIVPLPIEVVVMRLLQKRPGDRYASAGEVLAALDAAEHPPAVVDYTEELAPSPAIVLAPSEPPRSMSSLSNAGAMALGRSAPPELSPAVTSTPIPVVAPPRRRFQRVGRRHILGVALVVVAAVLLFAARGHRPVANPTPPPTLKLETSSEDASSAVPVEAVFPERDAARANFRSQTDRARWRGATQALNQLLVIDPRALSLAADRERAVKVANRASFADYPGTKALFDNLASGPGQGGLEVLYTLVESQGGTRAAKLARERLVRPEVQARLPAPVAVAMALRETSCKDKPRLFSRAAEVGDARTLRALILLRPNQCTFQAGECCFLRHAELDGAVRAIERRHPD